MEESTNMAAGPPRPSGPVREDRAVIVFLILAVAAAIALFAGLVASADVSPVERLVRLAPPAVWLIGLFVAAAGLAGRRAWAVGSLTVLLWLLVIEGIVSVLAAAGEGRLFIPIGPLLVFWVLRAPPIATGPYSRGAAAVALISVFALASVGPWLADAALIPGGPLIAGSADVVPKLSVDCGAPGDGVPETIAVAYDWSWRRTEALADSTDVVAVGWTGQEEDGTDLFILGNTEGSTSQPGIWQGSGSPSADLADRFEQRFPPFNGWTWGISLGEQRMRPGHIPFTLRRVSEAPVAHGLVAVQAAYIHLGRWINDDAYATCSW